MRLSGEEARALGERGEGEAVNLYPLAPPAPERCSGKKRALTCGCWVLVQARGPAVTRVGAARGGGAPRYYGEAGFAKKGGGGGGGHPGGEEVPLKNGALAILFMLLAGQVLGEGRGGNNSTNVCQKCHCALSVLPRQNFPLSRSIEQKQPRRGAGALMLTVLRAQKLRTHTQTSSSSSSSTTLSRRACSSTGARGKKVLAARGEKTGARGARVLCVLQGWNDTRKPQTLSLSLSGARGKRGHSSPPAGRFVVLAKKLRRYLLWGGVSRRRVARARARRNGRTEWGCGAPLNFKGGAHISSSCAAPRRRRRRSTPSCSERQAGGKKCCLALPLSASSKQTDAWGDFFCRARKQKRGGSLCGCQRRWWGRRVCERVCV